MRRADRLMQILLYLRGKKRVTADALAAHLEVSVRTVYRDMADLLTSGAPVNGAAGEGYWLEEGFSPPPVAFSVAELQAIEVSARMLGAWADKEMGEAAKSALQKVHGVLGSAGLVAPPMFAMKSDYPTERLAPLKEAINQKICLQMNYVDEAGKTSERVLAPLGLFFWGNKWTLAAWCFLRSAYRHFRVDRMKNPLPCEDEFPTDISLDFFLQEAGVDAITRQKVGNENKQIWHQ